MDDNPKKGLLDCYLQDELSAVKTGAPNRLPTDAELRRAAEQPDEAEEWIADYLRRRPDCLEYYRSLRAFEEAAKNNPPEK